jgi:hypothetical protein
MKKVIILPVLALVALIAFPTSSYALSCIDPEGAVKYFSEQDDLLIVTATPKENKEHVKVHANKMDPNAAFNEGYTAQYLEIKEAHRGSVPDKMWAYFQRNGTWNYLCAGEPAKIGTSNVYVLDQADSGFGVTGVAAVYPADSKLAKDLLEAVEDNNEDLGTPEVYKTDKTYWVTQLHDQLKEMAFIIRVKLAEWNFWKSSK